jgi:filamentous hemagglutinin family protein
MRQRIARGGWIILAGVLWAGVPAEGQIRPDNSLGREASRVVRDGNLGGAPGDRIEGGAQRGGNLFHSFREFNIGDGQRVYFTSPAGVDTILTRVTGTTRSDILGTLGVDGPADLFLMNPNGIFFGPNARLDVQGSMVATTADAIQLGNGTFSARNPQAPTPPLRVNPDAFVFNQLNRPRGSIITQAIAPDPNDLTPVTNGLSVPDGRSLVLLGGNVLLEGGYLRAAGGRVELGSVVGPGRVELRPSRDGQRLRLTYPEVDALGDVTLTNGAIIDVTGAGRGDLSITAATIQVEGGSNVCAGLGASSFCGREEGQAVGNRRSLAGNVVFFATNTITVRDPETGVRNRLNPGATGNSENIFDAIARLDEAEDENPIDVLFGSVLFLAGNGIGVGDGAQVSTSTSGQGNGGVVFFVAPDIAITNGGVLDSNVFDGAVGQAGGILISSSNSLEVSGGSSVESGTAGRGPAGRIFVEGNRVEVRDGARLSSAVFAGGRGQAGGILITGNDIRLSNGGTLNSSTFSQGPAGAIVVISEGAIALDNASMNSTVGEEAVGRGGQIRLINTGPLVLTNGSQINTSVLGVGNAGGIVLLSTGSIIVDNSRIDSAVGTGAVGQGGQIRIIGQDTMVLSNGAVINTSTNGIGAAGDIVVATASDLFLVNDSFILSLSNEGAVGDGGEIGIVAGGSFLASTGSGITTLAVEPGAVGGDLFLAVNDFFIVTDRSFISAETGSGDGGNLFLTGTDFIILANNSNISTSAGRLLGGGDGGNIQFDVRRAIFAVPFNDNNIRAEAFEGDGGNIRIVGTVNLFEIAERPDRPQTNDITASSQFGIDGRVTINELDVDPLRGLTELPADLVNAEDLITRECPGLGSGESGQLGAFYIIGRSGLPATPDEPRGSAAVIVDWVEDDLPADSDPPSLSPPDESQSATPMEFQRWQRDDSGQVWLVADGSTMPTISPPSCPTP